MGDRYFAANIGVWRAIMVGSEKIGGDSLRILTQIQEDVSFLNPGHEDNYYIATAILPWEGEVDVAQTILARATSARPTDAYPPFYFGFNELYFRKNTKLAVANIRLAAERAADEGDRQALALMAARWSESGNIDSVAKVLRSIADDAHDPHLREYLLKRARHHEILEELQGAAALFFRRNGRQPTGLDEISRDAGWDGIPDDPAGEGFIFMDGKVLSGNKERG